MKQKNASWPIQVISLRHNNYSHCLITVSGFKVFYKDDSVHLKRAKYEHTDSFHQNPGSQAQELVKPFRL